MRVLITGGAGFIGSHLADRFVARGDDVLIVDNLETGSVGNLPVEVSVFVADIAKRRRLYEIANGFLPELVVHCAASYSDPGKWHRDTDTNVTGTINATLTAAHHGARLVYFQTALPPISSYAITKIAGERFINLSGVPVLVFRLANMYGPRNVSGPIPAFYKRLTAGEQCTVVSTRRDMVFVADLVRGVMDAIDGGFTGRFDMCSGEHVRIESLYWAVAHELDVDEEPSRVEPGADDVTEMDLNPGPALETLGWVARVPLSEGVAAAVDWYRERGVEETYTHLAVKA